MMPVKLINSLRIFLIKLKYKLKDKNFSSLVMQSNKIRIWWINYHKRRKLFMNYNIKIIIRAKLVLNHKLLLNKNN